MIVRRRRLAVTLVAGGALLAAACNAIIGAPERMLDEGEDDATTGRRPSTPEAGDAEAGPSGELDAGADGSKPVEITVGTDWDSPNGAEWIVDGGTTITKLGPAGHAVIVPKKQPAIPFESYTVFATVRAPNDGEFGILTRVQKDGAAVLIGSKFGSTPRPFMGNMRPPEWSPTDDGRGPTYTFVPGARYNFKLQANGDQVSGKMWQATDPEPAAYQVTVTSPWSTGRGVGFYVYGVNGSMLETMKITAP